MVVQHRGLSDGPRILELKDALLFNTKNDNVLSTDTDLMISNEPVSIFLE